MHRSRTTVLCFALVATSLATAALLSARAQPPRTAPPAPVASDTVLLDAAGRQLAHIAETITPSVVKLRCRREDDRGRPIEETGSGVIIRHDAPVGTFVVTNSHVVSGSDLQQVEIHLRDRRVLNPQRIWTDSASDVAVMSLNAPSLPAARWGDSDKLAIGHFVLAVGSPFGLSRSVSLGIISAKGRRSLKLGGGDVINQDFLQTDAAINPGNSGGPLVDVHGRVVGINTAIATTSGGFTGVGFSIPSRMVRRIVTELLTRGHVRRAYLGVILDPEFTVEEARLLGLPRLRGARVLQATPGTPAARAGLQKDDVVLALQKIAIIDYDQLINLVSLQPIGSTVTLSIWRAKRRVSLRVKLTDRNEINEAR